nr:hypothetical protein [uncultured Kingella sp.]
MTVKKNSDFEKTVADEWNSGQEYTMISTISYTLEKGVDKVIKDSGISGTLGESKRRVGTCCPRVSYFKAA